jgi:hypothetical protein
MLAEVSYDIRRSSRDVQLLHYDDDVAMGGAPNAFMILWRDRTTKAGVAALSEVFGRFCERGPREVALFTIVQTGAKPPDAGARESLALAMRAASDRILISAVVYEQTGFLAAAFRGVVTGLCLIARQKYAHRMFADVGTAVKWVDEETTRVGRRFRADDLQSSVNRFRWLVGVHG